MEINPNKIKPINFLINRIKEKKTDIDVQIPRTAFFLGAGCSKSSDIPLGSEIIDILRQLWYIENFSDKSKLVKNDFEIDKSFLVKNKDNIEREVFNKELELVHSISKKNGLTKTQIDNQFNDSLYGFWFSNYSEDPRERQKIIEYFIDKSSPSGAYILLSFFIENNIVKNIFTTNFDDLINQALIQYTEIKARVYSHNEVARYINIFSCKPNIIKLHGDYLFENIKNTKQETESLEKNMEAKFLEALTFQDLVVIGYNGADSSIMSILEKIKSNTKFGLYWCGSRFDSLNWKVKELITKTENSYFVEIDTFEYFIYKLYESIEDFKIPDIKVLYDRKDLELKNYINKFGKELQSNSKIDVGQKDKIIDKLNLIINDNSFKEVYSLNHDERVDFLRNVSLNAISRIIKNISTYFKKSDAVSLYKSLDDGVLFQNKISESSIEYISNSLTNLKEVDRERTAKILNSIDLDTLLYKIKKADDSKVYSAIGELGNISPDKIESIKKQLKPNDSFNIENKSIRDLLYFIGTISKDETKNFININKTELIEKLKNENIKEIAMFFEVLMSIDKSRETCKILFNSLSNEELAQKMEYEEINQIGIASYLFSLINETKTFDLFGLLDEKRLVNKSLMVNFNALQNGIFNISLSNKYLAFKIIDGISDEQFVSKVKESQFIEISEGLSNLNDINPDKIRKAYKSIENEILINKLNSSQLTYQQFGTSINKLRKLDFDKTAFIVRNCNTEKLIKYMVGLINKTGPQVFLHHLPIISKIEKKIIDAFTNSKNKEFLNELLGWNNFELYAVNLQYLLDSFKRNGMSKEADYVNEVIKNNTYRIQKKKLKKNR